ncbi:hypothetical protein XENOCAPTIV_025538, partial [Xenoophorus captivus]
RRKNPTVKAPLVVLRRGGPTEECVECLAGKKSLRQATMIPFLLTTTIRSVLPLIESKTDRMTKTVFPLAQLDHTPCFYTSSLARACLRFKIRWYCLALTYRGSSSSISAPGRGIRCIVGTPPPPGTI